MSNQRELTGVQYLRGIAACAVAFDHASIMASFEKYFGQSLWDGWLEKGALGVDLFFMISGFIIAIVSLQPVTGHPKISVVEFARRRAFRILPMMWLAIGSYALLRFIGRGQIEFPPYLLAAVLSPVGDLEPNIIWTLRQEAVFYCLFAATFLSKAWLRPLVAIWAISPFAYAWLSLNGDATSLLGQLARTLMHPVNIEFGAGLVLGLVWLKWGAAWSIKVRPLGMVTVAYFVMVMAVGNVLDLGVNHPWMTLVSAILFAPLLALGIWGAGHSNPLLLLLGNASFAIYLFHAHIISALLSIWSKFGPGTPIFVVVGGTAIASIVGGVAIHLILERPLQKGLDTWWRSRPSYRERVTSPEVP